MKDTGKAPEIKAPHIYKVHLDKGDLPGVIQVAMTITTSSRRRPTVSMLCQTLHAEFSYLQHCLASDCPELSQAAPDTVSSSSPPLMHQLYLK